MGIDIGAEVKGLAGVMDMIEALDEKQLQRAAHHGLQEGLQKIRAAAVMLCPVDTGALKNSIKTRIKKLGNGEMVGEVYVGKSYGIYVEMGTGPRGEKDHKGVNPEWMADVTYSPQAWTYPTGDGEFRRTLGQPARPFLYPAYKMHKDKVREEIARAVIREAQRG